MRCPDCNKFVPYGEPDTDGLDVQVDGSELLLSGELALTCESCGSQLATASLEASVDLAACFEGTDDPDEDKGQTAEYELVDSSLDPTDRTEDKDRHGKQIKNPRYMRRFFGVEASCTVRKIVKDAAGNPIGDPADEEITIGAEEQASAFESCC